MPCSSSSAARRCCSAFQHTSTRIDMRSSLLMAIAIPALAAAASIEPGNWEFTVDVHAKGLGAFQPKPGPVTKTRCITPEQAANPAKVMSDPGARGECQFSDDHNTGAEYPSTV